MPVKVRFIKLGSGGNWEAPCIEEQHTIRIGYESPFHEHSLKGDWEPVWHYWREARKGDSGAATRDLNQIKVFYEASEEDLWITFYQRRMFWCHAHKEVTQLDDGTRIRRVIGRWSCYDKSGRLLAL